MNLHKALNHLKVDGWCVLDGIIPASRVRGIRRSVQTPSAPGVITGGRVQRRVRQAVRQGVGARTGLLAFTPRIRHIQYVPTQ